MRYAHFAKICEKCGKVPNTWQSHIRVFLTCLSRLTWVYQHHLSLATMHSENSSVDTS